MMLHYLIGWLVERGALKTFQAGLLSFPVYPKTKSSLELINSLSFCQPHLRDIRAGSILEDMTSQTARRHPLCMLRTQLVPRLYLA